MGEKTSTGKQRVFRLFLAVALVCMTMSAGSLAQAAGAGGGQDDDQGIVSTDPVGPAALEPVEYFMPNVTKSVVYTTTAPETPETFTFMITSDNQDQPMPMNTTVSLPGAGTANFGNIEFSEPGTYTYTVFENIGNIGGWTYDDARYTLIVKVADNGGTLSYTDTINKNGPAINAIGAKGAPAPAKEFAFTNTYTAPKPLEYSFPDITKNVFPDTAPAESFTFKIAPFNAGQPMPASDTATVQGAGTADFGNITYTAAGTYTYDITETAGTASGWTYDDSTYELVVTVTEQNGKLVASGAITKDEAEATDITFSNNYIAPAPPIPPTPSAVDYTVPTITKAVTSDETAPAETFGFKMSPAQATQPMPASDTVTVQGAGTADFGNITYTAAGTYTYDITETAGTASGWTYDDSTYELVVTVTEQSGKLVASGAITKDNAPATNPVFTNSYASPAPPAPTTVSHKVTKKWEGENYTDTRPTSVEVELYCDDTPTGKTVTLSDANNWMYTWSDLEQASADGTPHVYSVFEEEPVNYFATYDDSDPTVTAITNTFDVWVYPQVKKEADKAIANPGENVEYTITIENTTDVAMHGVWVKDILPEATEFVSCDPVGVYGESDGKRYVNWFLKKIGPHEDLEFVVELRVAADADVGTKVTNRALYTLTGNEETPDFTQDPQGGETPPTASTEIKPKDPDATPTPTPAPTPDATNTTAAATPAKSGAVTTAKTFDNLLYAAPWLIGGAVCASLVLLLGRRGKNDN